MFSLKGKPAVAKKDIECYKLLTFNRFFNVNLDSKTRYRSGERLYTPWQCDLVSRHITEGKAPLVAEGEETVQKVENFMGLGGDAFEISKGFIHTYASIIEGRKYLLHQPCDMCDYVLFKCIIPKGVEYYTSYNNEAYASKSIIFKELVA